MTKNVEKINYFLLYVQKKVYKLELELCTCNFIIYLVSNK